MFPFPSLYQHLEDSELFTYWCSLCRGKGSRSSSLLPWNWGRASWSFLNRRNDLFFLNCSCVRHKRDISFQTTKRIMCSSLHQSLELLEFRTPVRDRSTNNFFCGLGQAIPFPWPPFLVGSWSDIPFSYMHGSINLLHLLRIHAQLVYSENGNKEKGKVDSDRKQGVYLWFCHSFQAKATFASHHLKASIQNGLFSWEIKSGNLCNQTDRRETSQYILQLGTITDKNCKSGGLNSRYSCQDFEIKIHPSEISWMTGCIWKGKCEGNFFSSTIEKNYKEKETPLLGYH